MKKYFVSEPFKKDSVKEVTPDEYVRMANQQFFTRDAETMERIMESATKKIPVCGTTHMFWTEDNI